MEQRGVNIPEKIVFVPYCIPQSLGQSLTQIRHLKSTGHMNKIINEH